MGDYEFFNVIKYSVNYFSQREISSKISGEIYLLRRVNSASDWLPRYGHRVPVAVF